MYPHILHRWGIQVDDFIGPESQFILPELNRKVGCETGKTKGPPHKPALTYVKIFCVPGVKKLTHLSS